MQWNVLSFILFCRVSQHIFALTLQGFPSITDRNGDPGGGVQTTLNINYESRFLNAVIEESNMTAILRAGLLQQSLQGILMP